MSHYIIDKCKQCGFKEKGAFKDLYCKKFGGECNTEKAENCEYDQRHYCYYCTNFNREESTCKIDGHFKDEETLRVCKSYNRDKGKHLY